MLESFPEEKRSEIIAYANNFQIDPHLFDIAHHAYSLVQYGLFYDRKDFQMSYIESINEGNSQLERQIKTLIKMGILGEFDGMHTIQYPGSRYVQICDFVIPESKFFGLTWGGYWFVRGAIGKVLHSGYLAGTKRKYSGSSKVIEAYSNQEEGCHMAARDAAISFREEMRVDNVKLSECETVGAWQPNLFEIVSHGYRITISAD